jgi:hypothetical protein
VELFKDERILRRRLRERQTERVVRHFAFPLVFSQSGYSLFVCLFLTLEINTKNGQSIAPAVVNAVADNDKLNENLSVSPVRLPSCFRYLFSGTNQAVKVESAFKSASV